MNLTTLPKPDDLRPLQQAAEEMFPGSKIRVCLSLDHDASHVRHLHWSIYDETSTSYGHGTKPEEALERFASSYRPPETKADKIAKLHAEIAKLEGQK
jgi:hypothetical protein